MTWWQLSAFVVGTFFILAAGLVGVLTATWRRQERRDGKR